MPVPYTPFPETGRIGGATVEAFAITTMADVKVGQLWRTDDDKKFPGVWKIIKVNRTTVALVNEYGNRLNAEPYYLVPLLPGDTFTERQVITVGTVVKVGDGRRNPGHYVVIAAKGETANVAKVNGEDGRYLRGVPFANLTVVTVTVTEVDA